MSLQDRNRYNKIQELLQRYDPEERQKMELLKTIKKGPPAPSLESSPVTSEQKKMSIGTSLMYGAGKIVDSLANKIIGDQPELIAEVEYALPGRFLVSSNVVGIC